MEEGDQRGRCELTRDPVFLLQRREIIITDLPDGYSWADDILDESGEAVTPSEFVNRFLDDYNVEVWHTESVWFTRGEAEAWAKLHEYRFIDGWRVYCVCCQGVLATLLKEVDQQTT